MASNDPKDIDKYIAGFPEDIQTRLKAIRQTIRLAAPEAQEVMGYGMPAYKYHGMLVYFAAHKNHIGIYPYPSAMAQFDKELVKYRTSKSTVQFAFDQPLPLDLITKMVRFRATENIEKTEVKRLSKQRKS